MCLKNNIGVNYTYINYITTAIVIWKNNRKNVKTNEHETAEHQTP